MDVFIKVQNLKSVVVEMMIFTRDNKKITKFIYNSLYLILRMAITNIIISVFFTFYMFYFASFFIKSKREAIQIKNVELNKLRKIPVKSLEEQKHFLNIKYPKKTTKFKFSWNWLIKVVLTVLLFFIVIRFFRYLIGLTDYVFPWWLLILIVITLPILINLVLAKFNLQKSDFTVFFR